VFFVAKLYRAIKPKKINRAVIKALLKFCLPLVPSTVFWWITGVSDRYMVSAICSPEENGLYAVAYKIPTILTYVVIIFNDAWKISAVSDADDLEKNAEFYTSTYKYYQTVMFVGGAFICAFSWVLSKILFAQAFEAAWVFVPILTVATVFSSLDTFLGSAYFTVRRTGMSLVTAFIGAVVNVGLNILLIKPYGAMGASIATLASYLLVYIIRAATMKHFIPFKTYPVRIIINTVIVGAMAVVITVMGMNLVSILSSAALLIICILYNGRELYSAIMGIMGPVIKKLKKC
jgi:O-antigen/teichoic acid export membrane protein